MIEDKHNLEHTEEELDEVDEDLDEDEFGDDELEDDEFEDDEDEGRPAEAAGSRLVRILIFLLFVVMGYMTGRACTPS